MSTKTQCPTHFRDFKTCLFLKCQLSKLLLNQRGLLGFPRGSHKLIFNGIPPCQLCRVQVTFYNQSHLIIPHTFTIEAKKFIHDFTWKHGTQYPLTRDSFITFGNCPPFNCRGEDNSLSKIVGNLKITRSHQWFKSNLHETTLGCFEKISY